jgi:diaminohydroxyphosphoribosylaminopyrimidine deaminase / 5-amino-6-(5-phosphoribosylamino)uracil reductase
MAMAHQLAQSAISISPPNPAVGCVVVSASGKMLAKGATHRAGGPHAEAAAILDAQLRGQDLTGATAYVTLEPCSHQGRTGPCCAALIAAGIRKVVAATTDPNPLVAGQGFARLRAAGVKVEVGLGSSMARELNIGFFSRMVRKTPWVRLKVAASFDGHSALPNGQSQWITGDAARHDGHVWRARAGALLTGIGTVLQDDPRLDVRGLDAARQPPLAIIDSRLETPPGARLFQADRSVWIYCAVRDDTRAAALQAVGATVIPMPGPTAPHAGKVDLRAMLHDLARREVNELHVEAGHQLNGSFFREGLVDDFLVYLAPKMLGQGMGMASFGPLVALSDAPQFDILSADRIGGDLRILARMQGRDVF